MIERGFLEDEFDLPEKKVEKKVVTDIEDIYPKGDELLKGLLLSAGYLTSVFAVFILYFSFIFVKVPNPMVWGQDGPYIVLSTIAQLIAGALVVVGMYFISKPLFKSMFKKIKASTFFQGLKYAFFAYLAVVLMNFIDITLFGQSMVNANQQAVNDILNLSPFVGCLLTVVVAPIVEELIFRYYIFKGIERRRPILAFVVTSLSFAAIHLIASIGTPFFIQDLRTMPAYAAAGVVFCYAYYKTKDIRINILGHMLYNGLATILVLLAPQVSYVEVKDVTQFTDKISIEVEPNAQLGVQLEEMTIYLYDTFNPDNPGEGLSSITDDYGIFKNLEKNTHYLILIEYSMYDEMFEQQVYSYEYIDLYTIGG